MPVRFTVLASGSAGNASLLEVDGFGLLLDAGLGPRQLAARMKAMGLAWSRVNAAILTHTHGDHWNERTFAHLRRERIPLFCHPEHHDCLATYSREFGRLHDGKLVRPYGCEAELSLSSSLRCQPLGVPHDSGATFGFRFTFAAGGSDTVFSLGYVADLGSWTEDLAQALANVDLLAVEFNHDEEMECTSSRSPYLIARVLSDRGHLSNNQAASLLREVLKRSEMRCLQHVVQLHLSRECNRPDLAFATARQVLPEEIQLHTARQDRPGPSLVLETAKAIAVLSKAQTECAAAEPVPFAESQPFLPGWET